MSGENIRAFIFLLVVDVLISATHRNFQPEQIHLSLGELPQEMVVTWVTFAPTSNSFVWYGSMAEGLSYRAEGFSNVFIDKPYSKYAQVRYIHRVVLRALKPQTFYVYRCGSLFGLSQALIFKMRPEGTNWSPRLIIYGDMGLKGAVAYPYIHNETMENDVDAIIHVGDIAYNLDSSDGYIGDEFLRMIQPVASRVPYMTAVGNHEQAYNFSHYKNRFSMPGDSQGLYYSFDMGPAHFVAVSTEVYYFTKYGYEPVVNQFNWLQNDLREASRPENRMERPWIIVYGHRPMYCSSDTGEDCSYWTNILKCNLLDSDNFGLESLLYENGVDLGFWGHMHYYERSWPLYDNQVFNGSEEEPYTNPGACVHIITGAAGMKSGPETASFIRREWFPFFSSENSYTVLTISNRTHLKLEQMAATEEGRLIDSVWLIKDCEDCEN